jgi:hypothetical protein
VAPDRVAVGGDFDTPETPVPGNGVEPERVATGGDFETPAILVPGTGVDPESETATTPSSRAVMIGVFSHLFGRNLNDCGYDSAEKIHDQRIVHDAADTSTPVD